jgi:hypothetical protein
MDCTTVHSVADPGCLFRIPDPNFFYPGSRVEKIPGSGSASAPKNFSILNREKLFLSSRKYYPNVHPGLAPESGSRFFLPILDPGSMGHDGSGSRVWISNTDCTGTWVAVSDPVFGSGISFLIRNRIRYFLFSNHSSLAYGIFVV